MQYIFEHKLIQVPHPDTEALVTLSISNGQYHNLHRSSFRNPMKTFTRKQRQAARKALKKKGVSFNG